MTTIKLPKYVTFQNTNNQKFLRVSTTPRGDLVFDGTDDKDARCIFETVERDGHFQTSYFKSTNNGKFWRRSVNENVVWIYADAADVSAADSFQHQTQDETNKVLSFWSAPDSMFIRSYTNTGRTQALASFSRDVTEGGADIHTRFRVTEAAAPH